MDFGIALEIVRNGPRRNILNCHARLGKRFNVRLEIAQVAAKHRYAVALEQTHHIRQQLHVMRWTLQVFLPAAFDSKT